MASLEDSVDKLLKDESPQAVAVNSLIKVSDRIKGTLGSDIELKTDLTEDATCNHTVADLLTTILEMDEKTFKTVPLFTHLTQIKERKLLSLDRKSRSEIVEVARHPDTMAIGQPIETGFVKNFFQGKKLQR